MEQIDYQKQLDEYLMKKLKEQNDPNYGAPDRAEMGRIEQNNSDNALASSLMKSAAQMGAIGGKVADTSAVDTMAQGLGKTNQMKLGQIDDKRSREDKQFGMNADVYKYLAEKQRKNEESAATNKFRADTLAQGKSKAEQEAASRAAEKAQAQANWEKTHQLDRDKLIADKTKIDIKPTKVDDNYAEDYNKYTGKGRVNSEQAIKQLKELKAELDAESGDLFQSGGGKSTALLPDFMRTEDSLRWKTEIPGKANLVLKELFGGALSDSERKSEADTYYNDMLGNKANSKILGKKIETLEKQLQAEIAKAQYYEKNNRSLTGWKSPDVDGFTPDAKPSDGTAIANGKETKTQAGSIVEIEGIKYRVAEDGDTLIEVK
jgi:hypothetical protein